MDRKEKRKMISCPVCHSLLEPDVSRCRFCGAEKRIGYITQHEKHNIRLLGSGISIILIILMICIAVGPGLSIAWGIIFVAAFIMAYCIPFGVIKSRNKKKIVWRKKGIVKSMYRLAAGMVKPSSIHKDSWR